MSSPLPLLVSTFAMLGSSLLPLQTHAAEPRSNLLKSQFPEGFEALSLEAKTKVIEFAKGTLTVVTVVGPRGLGRPEIKNEAFAQELMPPLQMFEKGTPAEKRAYQAALKIQEALLYVGQRLRDQQPLNDMDLNRLLRCEPGDENRQVKLIEGISELLFDYVALANPSLPAVSK